MGILSKVKRALGVTKKRRRRKTPRRNKNGRFTKRS